MPEIVTLIDALDPDLIEAARSQLALCERRTPDVAALATLASLARSIEPELLRTLRVELGSRISGSRISVSAESTLWFSAFVESRGSEAITLLPEALQVLRPRLAKNPQLLEDARSIVERCHRFAPEVLQWEERIVYLALTGKTSVMEAEVLRGLRSISQGTRQPLENWISDMWPRLPPEAASNPLILKLHQLASGLMRRRTTTRQGLETSLADFMPDFTSFPMRELGVVWRNDRFVIGNVADAEFGIEVPDLDPVELDISFGETNRWDEQKVVERGQVTEIDVARNQWVRLRTLAGRVYELVPSLFKPAKPIRVFIIYAHDSEEHSQRVLALAERLRADGFESMLDQYVIGPPPEGWDRWLVNQIDDADFVLVVCTKNFPNEFQRSSREAKEGGSDWIIWQEIHDSERNSKYLPVILSDADLEWIPTPLRSSSYFSLTSETAYDELCRVLTKGDPVPIVTPLAHHEEPTPAKVDISRVIQTAPAEFIGREGELKILSDAWNRVARGESSRPHVLTLVGMGGEGKTTLVAKWAAELAAQGWPGCDAAFAWSFYRQGTSDEVAASSDEFLNEALNFFGNDDDKEFAASAAGAHEKGQRLASIVGARRTLLILDGLEPLQYSTSATTVTGELTDPGIARLLRDLAATSRGLCIVTTRYSIPDLRAFRQSTAPELELVRLSRDAGAHLLRSLGVHGTAQEIEALVDDVKGHPLTLKLLGSYLRDVHGGDARKRKLVKLKETDAEEFESSAFGMYAAYEHWLGSEGDEGRRAVGILRLMGLFDRPATLDLLNALWRGETITGLTEPRMGLSESARNMSLSRLEQAKLVTVSRDTRSGKIINLDADPLLREYFARKLQKEQPRAWQAANRRLYEHLCTTTSDKSEPTIEDLQPFVQAIGFGCRAGMHERAFDEAYMTRLRAKEGYLRYKLGAFNLELEAIASFFEQPWSRVSPNLSQLAQSFLLVSAGFDLRALGRIAESLAPMRAELEIRIQQEDWKNAAVSAGNISEIDIILGEINSAVTYGERSVTYADRSGETGHSLSGLASALHQAGRWREAETAFREAEAMQASRQSVFPLLTSIPGFQYCDLLLAGPERMAWQSILELDTTNTDAESAAESCNSVKERATHMLRWSSQQGYPLLEALDHLTLGRTALFEAIFERLDVNVEAEIEIESALSGLRRASLQHFLPLALLSRAWLRRITGNLRGPDSAQSDLDEAWQIAERGPMRLHMADIHLYRARLFGGMKDEGGGIEYPWHTHPDGTVRGPLDDLAAARKLIEQCGYWRRKEELEDAEAQSYQKNS